MVIIMEESQLLKTSRNNSRNNNRNFARMIKNKYEVNKDTTIIKVEEDYNDVNITSYKIKVNGGNENVHPGENIWCCNAVM